MTASALPWALELRHGVRVEKLVPLRRAREPDELATVARIRQDQRAVADNSRKRGAPNVERSKAEVADDRRSGLALAERRQHGTGIGAGRLAEESLGAIDEMNGITSVGERVGLPQAGNAGPDDCDAGYLHVTACHC